MQLNTILQTYLEQTDTTVFLLPLCQNVQRLDTYIMNVSGISGQSHPGPLMQSLITEMVVHSLFFTGLSC